MENECANKRSKRRIIEREINEEKEAVFKSIGFK